MQNTPYYLGQAKSKEQLFEGQRRLDAHWSKDTSNSPLERGLSALGNHIYSNRWIYGTLWLGAAVAPLLPWETAGQLVTSLYPGSVPLTSEQQDALAVATAFPETSLRFLPSNVGKAAFFANSWARYFNSNRYSASRKISPSLSIQQINQQLFPSWDSGSIVQQSIMPRGRKRKYNVNVSPGAYGKTVMSDGAYRYGLGRYDRMKLDTLKDLYRVPDTHCPPGEELKFIDVTYTIPTTAKNIAALVPSGGSGAMFAEIAKGTNRDQRIGNRIHLIGCDIRASFYRTITDGIMRSDNVALELWYDSQANGVGISPLFAYDSDLDFNSFIDPEYLARMYPIWASGDVMIPHYRSPNATNANEVRTETIAFKHFVGFQTPICIEYLSSNDAGTASGLIHNNVGFILKSFVRFDKQTSVREWSIRARWLYRDA